MQNHNLSSLVLEAAQVAYCITDELGHITVMSPALAKLLDVQIDDTVGKNFFSLLTPLLLEPIDLNTLSSDIDLTLVHDTKFTQIRLSKKLLTHSPPQTLYLFTDFTRQKRIEHDLDQARQKLLLADSQLQAMLDAMPAYISWISKDGRYLGANRHLAELMGLKVDEIIGQRVGFRGDEVFEQIVKTFFANKERHFSAEYRLTIDNKSFVTLLFGHKYSDDSAAVFVGIDISQRKLMEEQLREQAKLLEVVQDAIIVVDEHDVILFWNKAAEDLYGWKREDAIGNRKADLLLDHKEFKQHFEAQAKVFETGEWSGELHQHTREGRKIIVQSRRTLLDSIGNQPRKVLIVNTDITEKKQLENQLFRNQRVEHIGMIASGIAHDMNNVLTPIMASLEMLKQQLNDEKSQKRISMLENSVHRGKALMEQILLFARGHEGELSVLDNNYNDQHQRSTSTSHEQAARNHQDKQRQWLEVAARAAGVTHQDSRPF